MVCSLGISVVVGISEPPRYASWERNDLVMQQELRPSKLSFRSNGHICSIWIMSSSDSRWPPVLKDKDSIEHWERIVCRGAVNIALEVTLEMLQSSGSMRLWRASATLPRMLKERRWGSWMGECEWLGSVLTSDAARTSRFGAKRKNAK